MTAVEYKCSFHGGLIAGNGKTEGILEEVWNKAVSPNVTKAL